ncbi:MAG: helix-turn-helix domain-containing protein [Acidobacteria bacterium]|nr:helix-turn-helix domain-containing protein [Acidobacteriota bacterium]
MKRLIPVLVAGLSGKRHEGKMNTKGKSKGAAKTPKRAPKKQPTVGARIIEGLEQAIAWTRGENDYVRVTLVQVPEVDVREVRTKMGLSQAQFATKFGFPPATLRNWEQGRSRPDAPTRVLLAVIAKHPEAVEDVLRKAN